MFDPVESARRAGNFLVARLIRPSRKRGRARTRGLSAVEAAVLFAIAGSLLAVAVPAFVREVHASRFVEPVDGLAKIGSGAIAYATNEGVSTPRSPFPPSAPLTPATPPRGTREVDPPGAWDHPTWKALGFRAAPEGIAHAFSFGFDSTAGPVSSPGDRAAPRTGDVPSFVAHAHGDLDGDGVRSTFEIRGSAPSAEPPTLEPGMYVESEVE
jgi:hypothetical protein